MRLKVLLPTRVAFDGEVEKVSAEGIEGAFTLLPRHIDYVAALVPGLMYFDTPEGDEIFMAVDEGVLVKCGSDVLVSTLNAFRGEDLGSLQDRVRTQFQELDEREQRGRFALIRLEADLVQRYIAIQEDT